MTRALLLYYLKSLTKSISIFYTRTIMWFNLFNPCVVQYCKIINTIFKTMIIEHFKKSHITLIKDNCKLTYSFKWNILFLTTRSYIITFQSITYLYFHKTKFFSQIQFAFFKSIYLLDQSFDLTL